MWASLPRAYGSPAISALLREAPEDFQVDELLGFEPSGDGEHVFLQIEKRNLTTPEAVQRIARFAGVSERQVSVSGLKDKRALTRQWISVQLPGKQQPDWSVMCDESLRVLQSARNNRKLRRGAHKANAFSLVLRQCDGDLSTLSDRLAKIASGVPNYFGEQRFGLGGNNVQKARQWFSSGREPRRQQKALYLSAARAHLFNGVLAARVQEQSWNCMRDGELVILNGSNSIFRAGQAADLAQRLCEGDVHPSGPLYGKPGELHCGEPLLSWEQALLAEEPVLLQGLEENGLSMQRRALRVIPADLSWQLRGRDLHLQFALPSGCFATAVVRELLDYQTVYASDNDQRQDQ